MARKKKATPDSESDGEQEMPKFEDALQELQGLVDAMEKGDISLEDSLKAFERGVKLTRYCQDALFQAEKKVQQLGADGQIEDLSINASNESDNDSE